MTSKELREEIKKLFIPFCISGVKIGEVHYSSGDVEYMVSLYSDMTQEERGMPDIKFSIFKCAIIRVEFTEINVVANWSIAMREWADFLDEVNAQLKKDGKFEVVD